MLALVLAENGRLVELYVDVGFAVALEEPGRLVELYVDAGLDGAPPVSVESGCGWLDEAGRLVLLEYPVLEVLLREAPPTDELVAGLDA